MLSSIALTESGKWDPKSKSKVAWPWTVTSGGPGEYFATKAEAIAKVKELKSQGVQNIDVGCMQINLHYHPDAFISLEQAFDPAANVKYAAKFLTDLKETWKSWREAVRRYHSSDTTRGTAYEQRVTENKKELTGDRGFNVAYTKREANAASLKKREAIIKHAQQKAEERAKARAQANEWRKKKLAEYRARKIARQDVNNGS